MSYVTNGAALPPISHREYARRLREALGERDPHLAQTVFRPVPSRLFYLPVNGLLIAVGILMVTHQVGGLVGKLLAVFLIGNAFASLGFLGHEVLHNAVVRRRWIRDLVGGLCFSPVWLGPRLWRIWHNEMHHNHTQHPDDDPDTSATYARYQQSQALRLLHRLATRRKVVFLAMLAVWFPFHAHRMLLKVGRAAAPRQAFAAGPRRGERQPGD
jgi:fatty acid desaturase